MILLNSWPIWNSVQFKSLQLYVDTTSSAVILCCIYLLPKYEPGCGLPSHPRYQGTLFTTIVLQLLFTVSLNMDLKEQNVRTTTQLKLLFIFTNMHVFGIGTMISLWKRCRHFSFSVGVGTAVCCIQTCRCDTIQSPFCSVHKPTYTDTDIDW